MRKRTSTIQLLEAITNGLLEVRKAECSYKSSNQIDEIGNDTFIENLHSLCESGVFCDFIDWHFEKNLSGKDGYVLDSGAMNPFSENVVKVFLRKNGNATDEDIEKALLFEED